MNLNPRLLADSMNAKPTSAITTNIPHRLAHWCNTLQPQQLPVDQTVRQQAIHKLRSPAANARNIATIIERCPVLSLLLFCETNRQLKHTDSHCQNLVHAIGLLGMPRIETLIKKTAVFNDKHISEAAREGYHRALATSLLAADWAKQWCLLSSHWQAHSELLYWATLFQRTPLWALWLEDSSTMTAREYQRAMRNGAGQPSPSELGAPVNVIIEAVGQRWHLPEFCQQSWQQHFIGSGRDWLSLEIGIEQQQQAHFCHHPAFAVALANQLADQTSWCWSDHRASRLFKLLAASVNDPRAISLSHQQVASSSRQRALPFASELLCDYQRSVDLLNRREAPTIVVVDDKTLQPKINLSGVNTPAQQPSTRQKANSQATSEQLQPQTTSQLPPQQQPSPEPPCDSDDIVSVANIDINPSPATEPAPDPFQTALLRLSKQTDSFDDQHQLFKYLLQNLYQQLKLSRCSASLYNPANRELRTLYSLGAADNPAFKNFRHTIKGSDFFSMLLKKPTSFQLHAANYQKFWPLLPSRFRDTIKTPQFFIMSLFIDDQPFALIYSDCAGQVNKLTSSQYQQFKQLCAAANRCLDAIKNR